MKKEEREHLTRDIPAYWHRVWKYSLLLLLMMISYSLYFGLLLRIEQMKYLYYLNLLLGVVALSVMGVDYILFHRWQQRKRRLLEEEELRDMQLGSYENQDLTEHAVRILERKVNEKYMENCDLQDYVARWCHEVKLPLASALLLQEQIADSELRTKLKEPLERMRGQLQSMLLGCRLQSSLPDVQWKKVSLQECVRASIHNQQFFLIQKRFDLAIKVEGDVYTDKTWLVYILDQLLNNAIKYTEENPKLCITSIRQAGKIKLCVEDNGVGIPQEDIRHIFEKGFTGRNHHNGKYKSTGMGLYFVNRILTRLGHDILVESRAGCTQFYLSFQENPYDTVIESDEKNKM